MNQILCHVLIDNENVFITKNGFVFKSKFDDIFINNHVKHVFKDNEKIKEILVNNTKYTCNENELTTDIIYNYDVFKIIISIPNEKFRIDIKKYNENEQYNFFLSRNKLIKKEIELMKKNMEEIQNNLIDFKNEIRSELDYYDIYTMPEISSNLVLSKKKKKINVILIGTSGVGKSTLVNSMLNKQICKTGNIDNNYFCVTKTSECHAYEYNDIFINFWDTRGFFDAQYKEKKGIAICFNEIKKIKFVDVFVICIDLSAPRFTYIDGKLLSLLKSWILNFDKISLIVFTKTNKVKKTKIAPSIKQYKEYLSKYLNFYNKKFVLIGRDNKTWDIEYNWKENFLKSIFKISGNNKRYNIDYNKVKQLSNTMGDAKENMKDCVIL